MYVNGGDKMQDCKLLLFDLDGTLLRSDKTISPKTQKMLDRKSVV